MDVDALALRQEIAAQVVDAVDVVGMRMRIDDSVQMRRTCVQHLLAEIRSGVDRDARYITGC